jgi:predicted nucleic acid-binding protein
MICLDSTFIIDYLRGDKKAKDIFEKCQEEGYCTTNMNLYEVGEGIMYADAYDEKSKRFEKFIDFISTIAILPEMNLFAMDAARISAILIRKGNSIGDLDCLIAGIMQANGVTKILTRNTKHFSRIQGIEAISY